MSDKQIKDLLNNHKFHAQLKKLVENSKLDMCFNENDQNDKQEQLKQIVQEKFQKMELINK